MQAPWIIENSNLNLVPSPLLSVKVSSSGPSSLLTQIAGYWKLDEVSGTRFDSTANALDMNEQNGPVASGQGLISLAAVFDGGIAGGFLGFDDSASLFNPYGDFTINLWFNNPAAVPENILFSMVDETQSLSLMIDCGLEFPSGPTSAQLFFYTDNQTSYVTAPVGTISAGWHMATFIASYAGSTISIYLDGILAGHSAFGGMNSYTPGLTSLGAEYDSNFFQVGSQDETGVWNRALTPTEISTLYNGGAGITYPFS
jgi:hypothetical protein